MAELEVDDLYGDDDLFDDNQQQSQQSQQAPQQQEVPVFRSTEEVLRDFDEFAKSNNNSSNMEDDPGLLSYMFSKRGIDPNNISIQDEEGNLKQVRFDELPTNDQYDLLFNEAPNEALNFDEDETNVINGWRSVGMNPMDYINSIINDAIESYKNNTEKPISSVNNFSDDEIFSAKLKMDYPSLSAEERNDILESSKLNPDAYRKQVENIRNSFDEIEKSYAQQRDEYEVNRKRQHEMSQYNVFANKLNDSNFLNVDDYNVTLDDSEKENIKRFVYAKNKNGETGLDRALKNPAFKAKLAYYALYGDGLINDISKNYSADVNAAKRNGYAEGFAAGGGRNTVQYSGKSNSTNSIKKKDGIVDIDDLYN